MGLVTHISRKAIAAVIAVFALAAAGVSQCCAQEAPYKFDIGGGIGMSGYLGDANESVLYKHPGIAGAVTMRYIANTRWAFRGQLGVATLSGNSAEFSNVYPEGKTYEFTSTVFDLSVRGEFNFFPYGIGETYKRLRRWTPYLALGVGGVLASAHGIYGSFNIPMSVGVKYKLKERLNLGLEFSMIKNFTDHIDGEISDLYQIKSSFFKNTDWYSTIMFSVTYEFGKRCEVCNRID